MDHATTRQARVLVGCLVVNSGYHFGCPVLVGGARALMGQKGVRSSVPRLTECVTDICVVGSPTLHSNASVRQLSAASRQGDYGVLLALAALVRSADWHAPVGNHSARSGRMVERGSRCGQLRPWRDGVHRASTS